MLPKPERKTPAMRYDERVKRDRAFRKMILGLDVDENGEPTCMDKHCPCHGRDRAANPIDAHHIDFKSQCGAYTAANGISLCRFVAHELATNGGKVNGKRMTAKQYIIYVLEQWLDDPCWRWSDVYKKLSGGFTAPARCGSSSGPGAVGLRQPR